MATLLDILQSLIHGTPVAAQQQQGTDNWTNQDIGMGIQSGVPAMTRLTQTPVNMYGQQQAPADFQDDPGHGDPVTGQTYLTPKGRVQIDAYSAPYASYNDLQHVLAHEQIHALLSHLASNGNRDLGYPVPSKGWDALVDTFRGSDRAGSPSQELPAYMGAFKQGQLRGVSAADADQWNSEFMKGLPPAVAQMLQRIIQSAKASQK